MKILYLAAYKAEHHEYNMTYQDINGKRDLDGDMLEIDLEPYDIIIATPPCNYYSRTRGSNKPSQYAEDTKHLLPSILNKLSNQNKPFIVENVRNYKRFSELKIFNIPGLFVYEYGRHTYWTNIMFNPENINQKNDFKVHGYRLTLNTQGGNNVHNVIEHWLEVVS